MTTNQASEILRSELQTRLDNIQSATVQSMINAEVREMDEDMDLIEGNYHNFHAGTCPVVTGSFMQMVYGDLD